ncbi:sensor histidine kinase [Simiduia agarivorans]|uniref:histidine kinase n=1 Tax=Simiduia agarivorans (strain DSM 21679 / JCM 13881 / BCRC 17597 / SA1) TaxID=1117647 RepID=K4KJH1_SIMAS|nr:sensor histidine kinase [Simiduia agarivorans]AFU98360.1 histidine kinase [Simiduia agarivorans SA1 = DSM 21679]
MNQPASTNSVANKPFTGHYALWRPLARWPQFADLLLALLALILTLLMWSSRAGHDLFALTSFTHVATFQLAFSASLALLWRRSHPWQVHALVLSASVLVYVAAPVDGLVALAVSLYSLGRYEANRHASVAGVAAAAVFILVDRALVNSLTAGGTMTVMMVIGVWYLGRRLRFRAEYLRLLEERAQHLEREQHAEAERAVAAERSRIAREMHDVVAHQLSLMTVQAGAARTVAKTDPQAAVDAMAAVEHAGRQALAEMRQLLSVLRPRQQAVALVPQPGVRDLPALVAQVIKAGPDVSLELSGALEDLQPRLDLTVYRLVQEALTNVIKHAGSNVQVWVAIEGNEHVITVSVRDNGAGPAKPAPLASAQGHGLIGMRERVQLLGGTFCAGAGQTGFEVNASLPRNMQDA